MDSLDEPYLRFVFEKRGLRVMCGTPADGDICDESPVQLLTRAVQSAGWGFARKDEVCRESVLAELRRVRETAEALMVGLSAKGEPKSK